MSENKKGHGVELPIGFRKYRDTCPKCSGKMVIRMDWYIEQAYWRCLDCGLNKRKKDDREEVFKKEGRVIEETREGGIFEVLKVIQDRKDYDGIKISCWQIDLLEGDLKNHGCYIHFFY